MVSSERQNKREEITALTWHTTTRIAENLLRISEPFGAIKPSVGAATANMYLVIGQGRAALIDSGDDDLSRTQ